MSTPMFRLLVHEALPIQVAVDAVSGAATSAGVDPATAASLLDAIDSVLTEARARESFSAADEAITLQLRLAGNRMVATISDQQPPATASGSIAALSLVNKSNNIGMSVTSGADLRNHISARPRSHSTTQGARRSRRPPPQRQEFTTRPPQPQCCGRRRARMPPASCAWSQAC